MALMTFSQLLASSDNLTAERRKLSRSRDLRMIVEVKERHGFFSIFPAKLIYRTAMLNTIISPYSVLKPRTELKEIK